MREEAAPAIFAPALVVMYDLMGLPVEEHWITCQHARLYGARTHCRLGVNVHDVFCAPRAVPVRLAPLRKCDQRARQRPGCTRRRGAEKCQFRNLSLIFLDGLEMWMEHCAGCDDGEWCEDDTDARRCERCRSYYCSECVVWKGVDRIKWGDEKFCQKCIDVEGLAPPPSDSHVATWWYSCKMSDKERQNAVDAYRHEFPLRDSCVCTACGRRQKNRLDDGICCDCVLDADRKSVV